MLRRRSRNVNGLARLKEASEAAEELVELVGGVEVGFQFAGVEALAQIVEATGEEVQRGAEDFAIGEHDVAPGGVGAARQPQRIAEARASQRDRQAVFVQAVVEKSGQRHGRELLRLARQQCQQPRRVRPGLAARITAVAPMTSKRRKSSSPARLILPSFCRPAVEFWRGVMPIQEAKCRPERKARGSATLRAKLTPAIGPIPGMVARHWLV